MFVSSCSRKARSAPGARCTVLRFYPRLILLIITLLAPASSCWHPLSGTLERAQAQASATVQNVRVCDVYRRSVVLRWDAPTGATSSGISGYYLTWRITGADNYESKVVAPEWSKPNAVQLQPLDPTKTYTVTLHTMDSLGKRGPGVTLTNVRARGTYEAELQALTGNGLTGFLYLPEQDPAMGRVNITRINNDFFGAVAGEANSTEFNHSSVALNNQQHWHMILNDHGTGSITSRVKGSLSLADNGTRQIYWDCDKGPFARQTWYVILTPNKVEQFLLFPGNNDVQPSNVWPREQIMIRFAGDNAEVFRYTGGSLAASRAFPWRGATYTNVRQRMGMKLNRQGITFLADTDYNGTLEERGAFQTDLSSWSACYLYFTFGSYNNSKTNTVMGTSATGHTQTEYAGGNMHWGNVAFDAPAGRAPAVELSYFQQPDLARRVANASLDVSRPLTVHIPNPIPADAVARELVFTDRIGCIPCLTGRNKLVLKVNGVQLANKFEDVAWNEYPTYRWQIPAGILRQGANSVEFGQTGTPDPIGIYNVHIDIHVPPGSPAVAAYTPPPAHPVLDTMPNHTELEGWAIPQLTLTLPSAPVKGTLRVPVGGSANNTAYLAGNFVAFDQLWVTVNGATVWSQATNADGFGTLNYQNAFRLDTNRFPDGYYEVKVFGRMKGGAVGWYNGSSWYNYDPNRRLIIHNAPPTTTAPTIHYVKQTDSAANQTATLAQNEMKYIRTSYPYHWEVKVSSPTLLSEGSFYIQQADGTWRRWSNFSLGDLMQRTATGNVWIFRQSQQAYNWVSRDSNGLIHWKFVAKDIDGNTREFPFVWSPIIENPPPPPTPNSPPVVSLFSADPTTVERGWSSQLRWSVSSADTITLDNGIGTVTAAGQVCVTPTQTTTYTLRATNARGTTTRRITVTVTP